MRVYSFFMRWCCVDVEFQTSVLDEIQFDFYLRFLFALGSGARFETFARIIFLERHRNSDRGIVEQLPQTLGVKSGILGVLDLVGLLRGVHPDIEFQDCRGRGTVLGYGLQFWFEGQRYGQLAENLSGEVERIFGTAGPFGIEVVGEHVHHIVADVYAADVVVDRLHAQVLRQIAAELRFYLCKHALIGDADSLSERLLEHLFVLLVCRYFEGVGEILAVIGPDHVGYFVELGRTRFHFGDQGVENLVGVGTQGELGEIDIIGVPGQLRREPFVGFPAKFLDVGIAVDDVFQSDEHSGQRDLEFRLVAADGDVVGVDVLEIVVLVDARGEECAGQE